MRQCGYGGVVATNGGSLTLIGVKTTVHHNCTKGWCDCYGLKVFGSSSTIQVIFPLTKEQVSIDNGGGGNLGVYRAGINQIKTYSYGYFVSHFTAAAKAATNKEERRKEIAALKAKLKATPEANDAALNTPNV